VQFVKARRAGNDFYAARTTRFSYVPIYCGCSCDGAYSDGVSLFGRNFLLYCQSICNCPLNILWNRPTQKLLVKPIPTTLLHLLYTCDHVQMVSPFIFIDSDALNFTVNRYPTKEHICQPVRLFTNGCIF
jgi:hypothetical protein